jgi:peptidoglycan/xylan/chitin deacetylase (PgdA/CDA1 family)
MILISKRDRVAGLLSAGGILRVLEVLARRSRLLVLNYHRIGSSSGNRFDDGPYSATVTAFRDQVRYIRDHFEVFGQDELLRAARRGFTVDRATAVITFDDGYRDNFELAFPILRELGVPAFFFIATEYIDRPRLPWWDRIAFILKNTRAERFGLDLPSPLEVDVRVMGLSNAIRKVLRFYKTAGDFGEEAFFDHLESRAEVAVDPEELGRDLFVSWDQIRLMRDFGMAVGSHTHSHRILARLPEADQRDELVVSKTRLEAELNGPVATIAYPVGSRQAFSELTKSLACEVGYQVGFSYYGGVNLPGRTDALDVRRIAVELAETFPLFRTRAILHNLFSSSI